MTESLTRGGEFVYERGLLRKGVGLCHGVAGSVYTLLAVSDALDGVLPTVPVSGTSTRLTRSQSQQHLSTSDQQIWFLRAVHLAHLATSYRRYTHRGDMRNPDRPYSLYEGSAGMCCAWAEVIRRLKESSHELGHGTGNRRGMPGYDDLTDSVR